LKPEQIFQNLRRKLKSLGVQRVDVFVINGIAVYFGAGDEAVEGSPVYESLLIETKSSVTELKEALKNHQVGIIDYQTFCKQAAEAGVEKWIIDLKEMTVTYLDTSGNEIVVEKIAN
jgi:uncharacterized protein YbcV (DUF1398 family)